MNKKVPLWSLLLVFVILLLGGGFTGNHFYKAYKNQLDSKIKENENLIKQSKKTEDSLIQISNDQKFFADQLRLDNERLQTRNNTLYYELKKRNKQIFTIDADFMSNAKRISESSRRFYKENDTIR